MVLMRWVVSIISTKPVCCQNEVLARIKGCTAITPNWQKSAFVALDYAGQYVFCVSKQGRLGGLRLTHKS